MITVSFFMEWAIRSSLFIAAGALLLGAFRIKDPAVRLACWIALLCGSFAIPLMSGRAPRLSVPMVAVQTHPVPSFGTVAPPAISLSRHPSQSVPFDWARAALTLYLLVAAALLIRLCTGMVMSWRLRRRTRPAGWARDGVEIRESDEIAAPLTLGFVRCAIVLPAEWREWDGVKRDAVLAHEGSHIRRHDPAVQVLSAIHRCLVWHSPLSWIMHRAIVRTAEEVSDDVAVAECDRTSYAEILLEFMRRGMRDRSWQGVAMARYAPPEQRIHRILDGTALSRGVSRWTVAAIVLLAMPLAYVMSAADPQRVPEPMAAPAPWQAPRPPAPPAPALPAMQPGIPAPPAPPAPVSTPLPPFPPQAPVEAEGYVVVLGNNSMTESWNSNGHIDPESLRAKYGSRFAWFRRGGHDFVVTDSGVMNEFEKAMEPQQGVNRMQSGVNAEQSRVNRLQDAVNAKQSEVNEIQSGVNKRQELIDEIQAAAAKADTQALIAKLRAAIQDLEAKKSDFNQDAVNRRQSAVNEEQSRVNAEQNKVNVLQSRVNEQQELVSAAYGRAMQETFDSALKRGLARQVN